VINILFIVLDKRLNSRHILLVKLLFHFLSMLHITPHHAAFNVICGKYKDLVTSIYPFNKPDEGWCWPDEIL